MDILNVVDGSNPAPETSEIYEGFGVFGGSDHVDLSTPLELTGDFTLTGWFYHDVVSAGDVLFGGDSTIDFFLVDGTTVYMKIDGSLYSDTH